MGDDDDVLYHKRYGEVQERFLYVKNSVVCAHGKWEKCVTA